MGKKKKNTVRRSLTTASIFLGIVLAILLGLTLYAEYLLSKVNYVDPDAMAPTLSQEQVEAVEQETEEADLEFTGQEYNEEDVILETAPELEVNSADVVNILLIGVDRRKNEPARSDSMILCTFNKHTNTITLSSFMRDMYVKIPGYKSNRINVAYTLGGMQLLNKTLNHNFGVTTNGTVEIDFANFEKLIDLLGGIELELSSREANYINKESGSKLKEGVQTLTGEQALWYSRYRKDGGDFKRTNRQRIVLSILLERYKNLSLTELIGMLDDILPMVTTNLSKDEILTYMKDLFPMLAGAKIVTQQIPAEGTYEQAKINGMAVLVTNFKKNSKILADTFYVPEETEPGFTGGVG